MLQGLMQIKWKDFRKTVDGAIKPYLGKNIILYGCNSGTFFLKTYLKKYYGIEIKAIVDRWALSPDSTILHLYSLFYLYDENDVIINVTRDDLVEQFEDIGEQWSDILYSKNQIVNIIEKVFPNGTQQNLTYYDWLEYSVGVEFTKTIRRKDVDGEDAHGYYPTDWNVLGEVFENKVIEKTDAIIDFGCGKGAMMCSFAQMGFKTIGGCEYTSNIFDALVMNLNKLSVPYSVNVEKPRINEIACYHSDAGTLTYQLDDYNWFSLFNPFGLVKTRQVINNIVCSVERKPRKVHIIYAEPMGHNVIMQTELFEVEKMYKTDFYEGSYWTYVYASKT